MLAEYSPTHATKSRPPAEPPCITLRRNEHVRRRQDHNRRERPANPPDPVHRRYRCVFSSITGDSSNAIRHVVPRIGRETLRRILREGKISWQTTTTWKASTDPDLIAKMHRVLALYDTPPTDGRVICVDEFSPLNLQPRKGKAWRPVSPSVDAISGQGGVTSGYATSRSTLIASITTAVAPWMP